MRGPGRAVVTHEAVGVTMMERSTQRFGEGIGRVDDAGDMFQDNFALGFPFLNGKVLDVDVARARCRAARVDHEDSSSVVFVENGGIRLGITKFGEDGAEIFRDLGGMNGGDELRFG